MVPFPEIKDEMYRLYQQTYEIISLKRPWERNQYKTIEACSPSHGETLALRGLPTISTEIILS